MYGNYNCYVSFVVNGYCMRGIASLFVSLVRAEQQLQRTQKLLYNELGPLNCTIHFASQKLVLLSSSWKATAVLGIRVLANNLYPIHIHMLVCFVYLSCK